MSLINRLVWHEAGVVVESISSRSSFWAQLSPVAGYVRFEAMQDAPGVFLPVEVRPAHEPAPGPLVSLRGVSWSLQASREAHQAIEIYQQAGDLIARFSEQQAGEGCRHAA